MSTVAVEREVIQDALPVCLPPWRENPYRLVSLLEIVKVFKVHELFEAVRKLRNAATLIHRDLPQTVRKSMRDALESEVRNCQRICGELELPMSGIRISKALGAFGALAGLSAEGCEDAADRMQSDICITIEDELSLRLFFQVSTEKAKFYGLAEAFGEVVAERFASASYDIDEANKCYALSRNTSCVMHCMRVLETGLAVFAPTLGVDAKHKDWGKILADIEKAVTAIETSPNKPANWKDDREFYFQCIADFKIFKNAYRNASMHGRGRYDPDEAIDIMNRVRSFMQTLAQRLGEQS